MCEVMSLRTRMGQKGNENYCNLVTSAWGTKQREVSLIDLYLQLEWIVRCSQSLLFFC